MNEMKTSEKTRLNRKPATWKLPLLMLLGFGLAFGLSQWTGRSIQSVPEASPRTLKAVARKVALDAAARRAAQAREAARIMSQLHSAEKEYKAAMTNEVTRFEEVVRKRAANEFETVQQNIPVVVAGYGYEKAWELVKAMAKDKVSKGTSNKHLAAILNADLQDRYYKPLLTARQNVWGEYGALVQRLEAIRKQYKIRVSQIKPWDDGLGEVPDSLQKESLRIEKQMMENVEAHVSSAIAVAVDAVFLYPGVCAVGRVLGGIAARFATTAGVSLVISQCDSPAPGPCDIVAATVFGIGTVCTCRDVKKACVNLPGELSSTLRRAANEQENEIVAETLAAGRKLFQQ